jgi:16S rRNA (adenine1518-N6/adenine1519-N6)-dimethyltransferase
MVNAKKRFGQHFLTDPHKADSMINALGIHPGEMILEVGPGTGVLSERILEEGAKLLAVELDKDLIASLQERFRGNDKFILVQGDIIKVNPYKFTLDKFKLIGNLPYNISGAMVEWLIEYHDLISLAIITVQKEVANRLKAKSGSRDYGSLTVMAQSFYDIKRLFDIPPGCFSPKPRVFSSALSMTIHEKIGKDIDYILFRDFVRACFAQKRKKLVNSLTSQSKLHVLKLDREQVEKYLVTLGKKPDIRAEQLTLEEFVSLYKLVRG